MSIIWVMLWLADRFREPMLTWMYSFRKSSASPGGEGGGVTCTGVEAFFIRIMHYSPRLSAKNGKFRLRKQKRMPSERASQEEQFGANFSFVAPSSEKLRVRKRNLSKRLIIVHGFQPKTENFDIGKKGYHRKGHPKRSNLAQISAS